MRRMAILSVLVVVLVLATGHAALAAPEFPASGTDSYYVFGEIGSSLYISDEYGLVIGSGFAMNAELTVGVQIQSYADTWALGGFASYYLKPLVVNADVRWAFPGLLAKVDALYLLDVRDFKVGVGVGAILNEDDLLFFVEGTASYAVGKDLSAYASLEFFPNIDDFYYHIGVTYMLGR